MIFKATGLLSGAAVLLLATAAQSAGLTSVSGPIMVDAGKGFNAAAGATGLKVGDRVMAKAGGSAQITYPDGCTVQVTAGNVATVAAKSPCATGSTRRGHVASTGAQTPPAATVPAEVAGFAGPGVVTGGIVAGIGVGAGLAIAGSPASP